MKPLGTLIRDQEIKQCIINRYVQHSLAVSCQAPVSLDQMLSKSRQTNEMIFSIDLCLLILKGSAWNNQVFPHSLYNTIPDKRQQSHYIEYHC